MLYVGIFLSYVFLGLSLSAPMGPINAAQLEKGIRSGFFHAWILGIGALLADVIYMALIYLGVIHFLEKRYYKTFLMVFRSFCFNLYRHRKFKNANQISISNTKNDDSIIKSFFSGFFMSLSNPLTILFWLGIFGSILAKAASSYNKEQLLLYSLGIILGIFIWDITMASTSSMFRKILNARILSLITVVSGISLIIYGLYFGFQTYQIIFQ